MSRWNGSYLNQHPKISPHWKDNKQRFIKGGKTLLVWQSGHLWSLGSRLFRGKNPITIMNIRIQRKEDLTWFTRVLNWWNCDLPFRCRCWVRRTKAFILPKNTLKKDFLWFWPPEEELHPRGNIWGWLPWSSANGSATLTQKSRVLPLWHLIMEPPLS